jgi:hypothetical protein
MATATAQDSLAARLAAVAESTLEASADREIPVSVREKVEAALGRSIGHLETAVRLLRKEGQR